MDSRTRERLEGRAKVIKAMAHAARLCIVEALSGGERCVLELTERVGSDISTVSRHLSVLQNAGIVDSSRQGAKVIYRLRCPCVLDFFRCVEDVMTERERGGPRRGKGSCRCR